MTEHEVPLPGGDVTEGVVRVGDTVRRPVGDHTPTVHAVLRHLEREGFDGAPRVLGVDDRGREVLTYVEGEVAGRPWPAWVGDEDRGVSVARLLRRLDDALEGFGLPPGQPTDTTRPGLPDKPGPPPWFLGHRDVTPENTVFRDGTAVALVDFDLLRPSTRVDEVVNLLLWWAGWTAPADRDPAFAGIDPAHRAAVLVDAYGLSPAERELVVPLAVVTAVRSWASMQERAARFGGGWARMWDEGIGDVIHRRELWLRDEADALASALTS
ncbi:phosphotransferase [Jatrophihabitans sp. YIM 134969]